MEDNNTPYLVFKFSFNNYYARWDFSERENFSNENEFAFCFPMKHTT